MGSTFKMVTSVLLVEPYYSGSHKAWADGYRDSSAHDVKVLSLPGRFWKWRMFGGSLSLGMQALDHETPDVVLASDMLDLPAFLSHASPRLDGVKTVLYMHENQLTYPLSPTARDDLAYAYMNWSSMVRADEVWFNSMFHLESVFEALPKFLAHFPDHRHTSLVDKVRAKCSVQHVGVDLDWVSNQAKPQPPLIMWNQRWEYDKNPEGLFAALEPLLELDFDLALCGENFRNVPDEFERAQESLRTRTVQYGYAERQRYESLLNASSIVVSTAHHEFFGIGAVEAVAAGAMPLFPNRLSYPELIPEDSYEACLYRDDSELITRLEVLLDDGIDPAVTARLSQHMERFSWNEVASSYDDALSR